MQRVAAVPQPADLGRVRGLDLRDRVGAVLVRRPGARPRDAARPRAEHDRPQRILRHAGAGLARFGAPLAPLRDGLPAAGRHLRRRWSSRCTRWSASTSRSSIVPGWHTTIFPPYFVAGAIYSGFAMVLTLAIPLRVIYGLKDFITMRHLAEHGEGHAGDGADRRLRLRDRSVHRPGTAATCTKAFMMMNRMTGPYAAAYWALIACNVVDAAAAVVQEDPDERAWCCSSCRSSSTSACGWSASSSS